MKIKATCRIGIIYKKGKYKKGKAPVYARSTASGLSTGICTRCRIEPERWARRLERFRHRDKTALQINGIVKIVHIAIQFRNEVQPVAHGRRQPRVVPSRQVEDLHHPTFGRS